MQILASVFRQNQRSWQGLNRCAINTILSPAVLPPSCLIFIAIARLGLFYMKVEGKLGYGNTAVK
jgi:hypothetical protein